MARGKMQGRVAKLDSSVGWVGGSVTSPEAHAQSSHVGPQSLHWRLHFLCTQCTKSSSHPLCSPRRRFWRFFTAAPGHDIPLQTL